jgi:hypothetical protein
MSDISFSMILQDNKTFITQNFCRHDIETLGKEIWLEGGE